MSAEKVREYLKEKGMEDRITVHQETIDTVEHAAIQVGCSEAEIAKTLTFLAGGSEFTSVRITPRELEEVTGARGWCDVCKPQKAGA